MVRVELSRWSLTPELLTLLCLEAAHSRTRERLLALRDIVQGTCAAQVSLRLQRHLSTVLKWVHDFNARGPAALLTFTAVDSPRNVRCSPRYCTKR